jgi:hypothetical protein
VKFMIVSTGLLILAVFCLFYLMVTSRPATQGYAISAVILLMSMAVLWAGWIIGWALDKLLP